MKNKIIIGALALSGIFAAVPSIGNVQVKAEPLDAADTCFVEFVQSEAEGELRYEYIPLYNEKQEVNGRQYDFTIDNRTGYALLTEITGNGKTLYEVEELFYDETSPFEACEGMPVYITHRLYLDYKNGNFYNLADGSIVNEDSLEEQALKGFGYGGGDYFEDRVQTVNYARKVPLEYSIQYDLPNYYGKIGDTSCANTAGAVLIGYYDRFFENLIPDYKVYRKLGTSFTYKGTSEAKIIELTAELHNLMSTNPEREGTTYAEFQQGMTEYVSEHGYTYTTTNMFSWGNFDFGKYKQAVESGKPVALFLSGFALVNSIQENPNMDIISSGYCALTHVVVGCGYKQHTYYDANNKQIGQKTYLKVASALQEYKIGYLNINGLGNIDKAISVEIK